MTPMLLTQTTPDGVTFTYNPLAHQWTASKADRKSTSSESLPTLQDRIKKWETPIPKVPAPAAAELATTGLAGIRRPSPGELPSMNVKSLTGKIGWREDGAALVRYQEEGGSTWQSAHLNMVLLDPRTFEPGDTAYWQAVALLRHSKTVIQEAETRLAEAWQAATPVVSQIIRMEGRTATPHASATDTRSQGRPIAWTSVPSAPKYENRDYVSLSSAWPALSAREVVEPTEVDLAAWTAQADGSIAHPSGVRLIMERVDQLSAVFQIERPAPGGKGPPQLVFQGRSFSEAFWLAQLTIQVIEKDLPIVEEWRGETPQWPSDHRAPFWPILVKTQALGLLFTKEDHGNQDRIRPFVLQTSDEKPSYGRELLGLGHPVWQSVACKPDVVYMTPGPADELLVQVKALHDWQFSLEASLSKTIEAGANRLDTQHQTALDLAYGDVGDNEPCEPAAAALRLQKYFDRLIQKAEASPKGQELAQIVASLRTTVDNGAPQHTSKRPRRAPH